MNVHIHIQKLIIHNGRRASNKRHCVVCDFYVKNIICNTLKDF